ncbi:MAG TPA: hypothetical protein VFP50_15330 [Anaeromyxobacteraceae bacterium]|nr:hypothetical protein [Anaeromyxobacteraceae bacterium]
MPPVQRAGDDTQEGEFADTPAGWAQLWALEFSAARDALKRWQKRAKKVDERFRDDREAKDRTDTRWNLFTANVRTQQSILYGKVPQVSVSRRFADAKDDDARVAGEMLERLLNTDIERDGDGYALALQQAAQDYLLPGLGNARIRYELEEEDTPETPERRDEAGNVIAPAIEVGKRKVNEDVEVDYVHWQDQLWSPARVWQEVRWWAFRAEMSRDALVKRFGELGKSVPLNAKKPKGEERTRGDQPAKPSPWGRAEVWEVWDKERRKVWWYVEGFGKILDSKPDPLGLQGFWPFPRPMAANITNTAFVPTPDFVLAQDMYDEIDLVSTKITELQDALKVAGVYDSKNEGVQQLLENAGRNVLIPVKNWGNFAQGGGLKGVVDWMPMEQVVAVLNALREYRAELIQALDQVEGTSDLMRGQAADAAETATAQGIKARFGSVRIQAKQDELARFASELQWLKAQVIAKFFDQETILERSNAAYMFDDMAVARRAVGLIKEKLAREYRVQVKPENVSLQDFAALKQEKMEVLGAVGQYLTTIGPLAQQAPGSAPFLLEILQWTVGGLRGASTLEGIIDRAVTAAKQAAQAPQGQQAPDPKLLAAQAKMQAQQQKAMLDEQKAQADLQRDGLRHQMDVQAETAKQEIQTKQNIQEEKMRLELKAQAKAAEQALAPVRPDPLVVAPRRLP